MNIILDTDSYKLSHYQGYPSDAEFVYSYAESRGGAYDNTLFFGGQPIWHRLANTRITKENIQEAAEFAPMHGLPFNREGWNIILEEYDGKLPLMIKSVDEGTLLPTRNVLVTVENTDPRLPWLTSYIETALIRLWYPTTVATRIHGMKQAIKPYFKRTSDSENMDFALLDFGSRGVSSLEQSELGGLAYLSLFKGSDNIPAIMAARKYYNEPMAGFSIPATEHSVMTSWGKEAELESFEYLIENMMPENGILSVVSDTWNVYEAAKKWVSLAEKIRNKNGTIVIRPDSGDMRDTIPRLLNIIVPGFGSARNSKGYGVLNNVKLLQGDGIDKETITQPFFSAEYHGISADSVLTGSGGGILQSGLDRDTLKFAFKASNVVRSGINYPIRKDPITDTGKRSKAGRLLLMKESDGSYVTKIDDFSGGNRINVAGDRLRIRYYNGHQYNIQTLDQIRANIPN